MKASIKKYDKYLVQSKTLPIFAVPRNAKVFESKRHIFTTADKAGSLSDNSSSEVLRFLAEIGALPLVTYILLKFFRQCQETKTCSQWGIIVPELHPYLKYGTSSIFLTKKSFFAFNPLHRTNCVISSRYFVQPCMSLQCDNQNGCMKTVFRNISEKCLRNQKFCVHLSSANGLRLFASQPDILNTADKAAIPGCNSTRVVLTVCQNTKGVVASFYIKQILHQWQTVRILQPAHQVRPLQRKSVRKSLNLSLIFLTRKSSIVSNLFQRVRSAISLRCSVSFSVCS